MHHLHVETMQEQPVADMNKSVENLLISSHDVISSINSSSLGTQNSNAGCSNAVLSSSPETNAHDAASGQEKSSPMSSPNLSPKPSPKNHARKEIYKSNHLDNVCKESVHLSKSDEQQAQETINKSSDSAELSKSSSHKRKKDRNRSKKKTPWYNVLYPTYKSRSEDFKRIFKDVPDDERLVVDYSCALQREILVHGRLYVSQNYACFYANIFMWETLVSLRWKDVTSMTKEKTALVIPNAILLCTETNKFFFTSFGARDKTYLMLFRVWQNALIGQPMSMSEMWQLVHTCYGDELGLTSDDEDYVPPPLPPQEDDKMSTRLSVESFSEVEGEKNYCEKGDLPEQCRIIDPSPTTSSPVDPILVEAPLKSESHIDPTDLSDTTESEADKHGLRLGIRSTPVCTSTHEGRQLANATFPMHIDQLFTLLFTNSKFFLDYHTARKTTDLVQSAWTQNDQTGQKMRTISLVVHLTQSIGPKTSQVTETQVMLPCSVPGSLYSIDVECVNAGIPYADSFSLASHYCLTRVSENETNLSVFCQIKYKKSVWSFVRSVIEKNCWVGLEEYFNSLVKALSVECEEASGTSGIKRKTRRRRRVVGAGVALPVLPSDSVNIPPVAASIPPITSSGGNARGDNGTIVSWVLLIAVLCLTVINGLLYYKLWGLEEAAAYTIMDLHVLKNTPKTDEDWINLLQQQESLHNVEMRKWQRVLHTAAQLLRQTEESLTELQMSIHPTASEKMFSVLKPGLNNLNTHTEQQRRDEM